uniref:SUEL-type lectin domain-containing protein n=1 Tax=Gadus morhua TaxID=8049 RepID=A0A8C5CE75_GADMO
QKGTAGGVPEEQSRERWSWVLWEEVSEAALEQRCGSLLCVLPVAYGRTNRQTCSEGKPSGQVANTACSQSGALEALANRCNGKIVCEVDKMIFGADPCPDTHKYTQTTYKCLPAHHVFACELSTAELICEPEVIKVVGAFYGRNNRTTCPPPSGGSSSEIDEVCISTDATQVVAQRCDGKSRCTVRVNKGMFVKDPCGGIFKYMELAYTCECKQRFLQCGFSLLV